jgi:uncharacterized protein (TIGR00297 family)
MRDDKQAGVLTTAEVFRKLAHMAAFWPAFLLPWLTPGQALLIAFALVLMNVFVLPKVAKILYRKTEPGLGALEIILYPSAVMACILAFGFDFNISTLTNASSLESLPASEAMGKPAWYLPIVAAWFGLAIVDALIGIACRLLPYGPTFPWNDRKPILAVTLGALVACLPAWLLATWALPNIETAHWIGLFAMVFLAASAETAWFGIADNLIIPFSLSVLIPFIPSPLFPVAHLNALFASLDFWLVVPFAFGIVAYWAGLLTLGGSVLGGFMALLLILAHPWLFVFLGGFFLLGNLATLLGRKRKHELGIAEARGGKRGAAQVFGAMGMAAWMTPLVHLTSISPQALLVCIAPLIAKTMDTVSSEIGKALAGRTLSLKTFRSVPPGTDGGVSLGGTLWGLSAALALCLPILALRWGGILDVAALLGIAILANLFESYWGEWAEKRGMDPQAHTNVMMTLVAAILGWIYWIGTR